MKRRTLLPHQRRVLQWAEGRTQCPFFLDMRLGKTLTAIRWAENFTGRKLIVAPLGVSWVWHRELSQEGHGATFLYGSAEQRVALLEKHWDSCEWFIINYEGLTHPRAKGTRRIAPSIPARIGWDTVILDESPRIRNPQTHITRVVNECLRNGTKQRAILTGLPDPESNLDYFEQFRFVYGSFLGCKTYWEFRHKHFDQYGFEWVPKPGVTSMIRSAIKDLAYRLLWKDVYGKQGKLVRLRRLVSLPTKVRREYDRAEKEFALSSQETKWSVVVNGWLRQLAGGRPKMPDAPVHDAKLTELMTLLEGELSNEPVLVWYSFTNEGRAIEEALATRGISVRRISGTVPLRYREQYTKRFQAGKLRVLCLQTGTSRYGLDFSRASTMIYYSLPVSNDQYSQSLERMRHPLKKGRLAVIALLCRDTVDEHLYEALLLKRHRSGFLLNDVARRLRQEWDRKYRTSV